MEAKSHKQKAKEKTRLAKALEGMDEKCRKCRPLTPLECVEGCDVWKFKNELRQLHKIITQKDYSNLLLNILKNKRRLKTLETLSKSGSSISQLQKELKKQGYIHSQKTIINEYVAPLITAGLVASNSSCYRATTFGNEVNQLFASLNGIGNALSPHSECYEEKIIEALFEIPKTFEELKFLIKIKSLPRALERLQRANLITKDDENNYIFYFKTKRNSNQEKLSPTEKRLHENIPKEGISAEKLAEKTEISLRRTYKYLRKLRGKKLAFKRKNPKKYALTVKGAKIAETIGKMHMLLADFAQVSSEVIKSLEVFQPVPVPDITKKAEEQPPQILVKSDFSHKAY